MNNGSGNGHVAAHIFDGDFTNPDDIRAALEYLAKADHDHAEHDNRRFAELTTAVKSLLGGFEVIRDQGELMLAYHQATLVRVAALDKYLPMEDADVRRVVDAADKVLDAVKMAREAKDTAERQSGRIDAIEERNRGIDTESIRVRATLTSEVEHLKEETEEIREELETTAQRSLDALVAKANAAQADVDAAREAQAAAEAKAAAEAVKNENRQAIVAEKRASWSRTHTALLSLAIALATIAASSIAASQCGQNHVAPPAQEHHP